MSGNDEPGAGVFCGLGKRIGSTGRGISGEGEGVFGSAGSGDIGLGGVCPGTIGPFWRSDADDTIGRIIPGVRFGPAIGGGNGTVSSDSEAVIEDVGCACAGVPAIGTTRGGGGKLGSCDVGTSPASFARSVISVISFIGVGFCSSPTSPVFVDVNSIDVFGIMGECDRRGASRSSSCTACLAGASLPALSAGLSGVSDSIGGISGISEPDAV